MIRTYKRKLILTKVQEKKLRNWIGTCRYIYNLALEVRAEAYKKSHKSVSKYDLMNELKYLKSQYEWIKEVPTSALINTINQLDKSYIKFFKGAGFPKWSSKKKNKSIVLRGCLHVRGNMVKIPNIGWLKTFHDREIPSNIKNATIKIEPKGMFVYIQCDIANSTFVSNSKTTGLDMGLKHFCVDSNGGFIANPKHFKIYERKLRIENRSLARKIKYSKSWYKQAKKLSLLHHKIANVRKDFLHKQSTLIAKANSIVYMEDLNISGMAKNKNLSKHILDAGWGMFKTMLEYKTNIVSINPAYTSQRCFECGNIDKANRLSQSGFECLKCDHKDNADINAAKNIKHQGMMLAREREALACA